MTLRLAALIALAAANVAWAENQITCLPSAPTASVGSSVLLRAWFGDAAGAKPEFKWSVTTGVIRTENGSSVWDLRDARPGKAFADVDALVNGTKAASCSVELHILGKEPSKKRGAGSSRTPIGGGEVVASGLRLVTAGEPEPDGFGLYSYILIGAPPAPADRDRYIALFDAVVRLIRPLDELARALRPSDLNRTCLPVKAAPVATPDAKWLMENYDYSAATVNLARGGLHRPAGIYILSTRAPLTRGKPVPPFLLQDLSHVPAALASTWVTLFLNQAAQEHFWNANTFEGLAAKLRLAIALTAEGVPSVQTAVASMIQLTK